MEECGALPEEFLTPAVEEIYEIPVATEEDLIQHLSIMSIKCDDLRYVCMYVDMSPSIGSIHRLTVDMKL